MRSIVSSIRYRAVFDMGVVTSGLLRLHCQIQDSKHDAVFLAGQPLQTRRLKKGLVILVTSPARCMKAFPKRTCVRLKLGGWTEARE
jgi:hypothetical protein